MEIDVINTMGFPGYFLIVADFINWAKSRDIPVGPGRGSGAGSLAAYCMRITDLDPMPYGLIFERFLNIERKSMPDFDVDFCMDRRGEVIDYVREKYGGAEHVAQIVTYGSMKARGVIRDVGRALDIPFGDVDKIAKLVPEQLKMTIKKAMEEEPRLQEAADRDPAHRRSCSPSPRPRRIGPPHLAPMPPALWCRRGRWSNTCPPAKGPTKKPSPSTT